MPISTILTSPEFYAAAGVGITAGVGYVANKKTKKKLGAALAAHGELVDFANRAVNSAAEKEKMVVLEVEKTIEFERVSRAQEVAALVKALNEAELARQNLFDSHARLEEDTKRLRSIVEAQGGQKTFAQL